MTFYRHFVERPEFEVAAATTDIAAIDTYREQVDYPVYFLRNGKLRDRILRTRFGKWLHSRDHLHRGRKPTRSLMEFCKRFRPDAVFTVAGSWLWTARLAETVANELKLPLIGSFNDWWYYNQIYHLAKADKIETEFRNFYSRCDLALCTSEGMMEELGPHPNSAVWYPTGAICERKPELTTSHQPYRVAFAGNLGEWYGTMVQQLMEAKTQHGADIDFRIFGSRPNWSPKFLQQAQRDGSYRGQIPFEQLQREMNDVDALLLPMGFEKSIETIERTSFKTKFLDYLSFGRPIVVWAPEYSSAVKVASEFDSAEICTSPNPADALSAIIKVSQSPARQQALVVNALRMYEDRFNPDKIHGLLVKRVKEIVVNWQKT